MEYGEGTGALKGVGTTVKSARKSAPTINQEAYTKIIHGVIQLFAI